MLRILVVVWHMYNLNDNDNLMLSTLLQKLLSLVFMKVR